MLRSGQLSDADALHLAEEVEDLDAVKAALLASDETGLDIEIFPEVCPWDMTDVMRIGWLPE